MKPTNLGSFHLKGMVSAVDPHENAHLQRKGFRNPEHLRELPTPTQRWHGVLPTSPCRPNEPTGLVGKQETNANTNIYQKVREYYG